MTIEEQKKVSHISRTFLARILHGTAMIAKSLGDLALTTVSATAGVVSPRGDERVEPMPHDGNEGQAKAERVTAPINRRSRFAAMLGTKF